MSLFRHGDHGGHDGADGNGNPAAAPMRDPVAGQARARQLLKQAYQKPLPKPSHHLP